jgi:ribosomal-protein-alanine N-acetyltransferase
MLPKQNPWDISAEMKDDLSRRKFSLILKALRSKQANDVACKFGIFLKSDVLVGSVSIMSICRGPYNSADLGFQIFNQFWGHGYGKEAVQAGVNIAFKELKLHRLEAKIPLRNIRSIRIIKALGFRKEGISKRRLNLGDSWIDLYIFALTAEELD